MPTAVHGVSGQRTLVVGASSGIGRGLACELAAKGATVVAAARRADCINDLAGVAGLACDVSVPGAAESLVERAVDRLGGLDAIVYAVGMTRIDPLDRAGYADWIELFAVNLFGAALVTTAALPHLLADDSQGRAIYLSSESAERPYPGLVLYGSAKAALGAYTRGLAGEIASLRVTEIVIGPTAGTEMGRHFDPDEFGEWANRWSGEGYTRFAMLQLHEVVPTIVETLVAASPPAQVWAVGAEVHQTLEETSDRQSGPAAAGLRVPL